MHPHLLRLALGPPRAAAVLEVADQLLLLGVHRDHRLARGQERFRRRVDVGELGVAIGVAAALARLAVALQAVAQVAQRLRDPLVTDPVPQLTQGHRQLAHALAGPAQRRLRGPARHRLHQPLQVVAHARVGLHDLPAPAARAADPPRRGTGDRPGQLGDPQPDRRARQAGGAGHRGDAAPAEGEGFGRRHGAAAPLVQHPRDAGVASLDRLLLLHGTQYTPGAPARPPCFLTSPKGRSMRAMLGQC